MRFFTYTLTSGSLSISTNDSAQFVSIQTDSTSGSCSVLGNFPFKGLNSTAVTLGAGQGVNLSTTSPNSPLDGLTITWISGSVDILIGL
jgi:hypothetical protein